MMNRDLMTTIRDAHNVLVKRREAGNPHLAESELREAIERDEAERFLDVDKSELLNGDN